MSMADIRSWACDHLLFSLPLAPNLPLARMIARIWHGWTKRADAKAYEKLLRDDIFPGIAARNIEGYHGAELFVRDEGDEVEFVTLLRFDSMDAVKEFAGADASKPVIYPKAEALITRMEPARHYRVAT
jgi:antibiotic biosynthesis monooxygenase (ABM) superfamily enzyme